MKYFILAGEASGDKQAALLCSEIRKHDPAAEMIGWGGEAMSEVGVVISKHYRQLAFMGFVEVIKHLPEILRNFAACKKELLAQKPDALILVDYPGFNLRMATWAYKQGLPVYYYISPQLWAWHTSRVHKIKKAVRKMYVILPFEAEFYRQYGMEVMYIGHPLASSDPSATGLPYHPISGHIALLPGSRKHEVERLLPVMVAAAARMSEHTFHVVAVPHLEPETYTRWTRGHANILVSSAGMQKVLSGCEAAVVTSGTATLETALYGVPQIVVYKGNALSYQIAKRLIKVKYISLVNLILNQPVIPELIQSDCTPGSITENLEQIRTPETMEVIRNHYRRLQEMLHTGGGPAAAAIDIISDIRENMSKS